MEDRLQVGDIEGILFLQTVFSISLSGSCHGHTVARQPGCFRKNNLKWLFKNVLNYVKLRRETQACLRLLHSAFPTQSIVEEGIPSLSQQIPAEHSTGSCSLSPTVVSKSLGFGVLF